MNTGQSLAIAGTFAVAAVSLFFNAHHYSAFVFGAAAAALVLFAAFRLQRIKIVGSIQAVDLMRFLDLKQESPQADGKNLSSFHLLMFVEVASAGAAVTLSHWTLNVEARKNSYPTRLADVTGLPNEKAKRDLSNSPLRHLSTSPPLDFKSLPEQVFDGVDSTGRRGWIQFDVYRVDDVLKTDPINLALSIRDSLGHQHVIRRTLTDEERADLM